MTLKEKLDIIKKYDEQDPHETFMTIADDYAIEFAEWYDKNNCGVEIYKHLNTHEQLLEIFKKEKGL